MNPHRVSRGCLHKASLAKPHSQQIRTGQPLEPTPKRVAHSVTSAFLQARPQHSKAQAFSSFASTTDTRHTAEDKEPRVHHKSVATIREDHLPLQQATSPKPARNWNVRDGPASSNSTRPQTAGCCLGQHQGLPLPPHRRAKCEINPPTTRRARPSGTHRLSLRSQRTLIAFAKSTIEPPMQPDAFPRKRPCPCLTTKTLRQMWRGNFSHAAMCVRNVDVRVLQFTR
jgi:hypothetical protein